VTPEDFPSDSDGDAEKPASTESEAAEGLGPGDEEAVRRLLRGIAAEPVRMPVEVAGRLEDVLAGLTADDEPVRRTPRWPKVLVAAAAVSVIGLGVGNILGGGDAADFATSETAGRAAGQAEVRPEPEEAAGQPDEGTAGPQATSGETPTDGVMSGLGEDAQERRALPRIRSRHVTADIQRLVDFSLGDSLSTSGFPASAQCRRPDTSTGERLVAVRLDGELATLVLRAPDGGSQVADVFSCEDPENPVESTVVKAR
jgi:hypothetical protein